MLLRDLWRALMIGFFLLLSACQKPDRYEDLISHPKKLEAAVKNCRETHIETAEHDAFCEIVASVASDFVQLAKERQQNPEKFGQKILAAQMELARIQRDIAALQQDSDHSPITQQKLPTAQKKYQTLQNKIKIFLNVVAVTTE